MKYCLLLSAIFFSAFTSAKDYGNVVVESIVAVYDGDTFRVNIANWPAIIGTNTSIRVKGVDTPEIRTHCQKEKTLAYQAKEFTQNTLLNANRIELRHIERGKYFRILAEVYVDGENLAELLINQDLGVSYEGKKRQDWCK